MDLLSGDQKKKRANAPRKTNGWDCLQATLKLLITSGYGFALLLVIGFVGTVWAVVGGMESPDQLKAFQSVLGWPAFSIGGWIFAAIVIMISKKIITSQRQLYLGQIGALRTLKDDALDAQGKLPLDVSPRKKDENR